MIPAEQLEQFGEGVCVARWESNGYHDSDFYGKFAIKRPDGGYDFVTKETGSTRFGGGYFARVDATEEVFNAYRLERQEVVRRLDRDYADRRLRAIEIGKQVVVVKAVTRGANTVAIDTVGEVFWRGQDSYRSSRWHTAYRIGLRLEDRKLWLPEENVRVVGFENESLPILSRELDYAVLKSWPHV